MIRGETTTYWKNRILTGPAALGMPEGKGPGGNGLVILYPEIEYQKFEGFGGAITEATGSVLRSLPEEASGEILRSCFGREGLNYRFVRSHIDSCDFSLFQYSSCLLEGERVSIDPESFSAHDGTYIIPFIRKAGEIAGSPLTLYLTPWSPPGWMKDNGQRVGGGKLRDGFRKQWAEYLCEYLLRYEQEGLPDLRGIRNSKGDDGPGGRQKIAGIAR